MSVTVRPIGAKEWPLWRDLRLRALTDSPDAFRRTLQEEASQPDEWWSEMVRGTAEHPRGGLWVAVTGDGPAGMLFGRIDEEYTTLEIAAMWVAPELRREGAGSALIRAVVDWARGSGVSMAHLWVTEANADAVAFYEHIGFQPTEATAALRPHSQLTVRRLWTRI